MQVSKGLSVVMPSLWAQQTGRGVLQRLLQAERKKGAHLGSSLEGKDARLHDLDATVSSTYGMGPTLSREPAHRATGFMTRQPYLPQIVQ